MKIVYCLNSIQGVGGIQVVTIEKANELAENMDLNIYILVTDNKNPNVYSKLSPKVKLIDLDINYYESDWLPGFYNKLRQKIKGIKHFVRLFKTIVKIEPNVVISVGQNEKFKLGKFINFVLPFNVAFIREVHLASDFRLKRGYKGWKHIFMKFLNFIEYDFFTRLFYDKVVLLTNEDLNKNWRRFKNSAVIPNPNTKYFLTKNIERNFNLCNKRIISIGRFTEEKNYLNLVKSFCLIASKYPDWSLSIYGDNGNEKQDIIDFIKKNSISNIFLNPPTNNVIDEYHDSDIFVSSSRTEGLPLVIIEAMATGLPIISFNYEFGPKCLIEDGVNGILVENNNINSLALAMEELILNPELRILMSKNSLRKAQEYEPSQISKKWILLFESLVLNK